MAIIAIKNIKVGKTKYRSGSTIKELGKEQERQLVEEGAASYCTEIRAPDGADMSVKDLRQEVNKINDSSVIQTMLDQESASDVPRTTAIDVLKKRLEELT